ncbi:porin [Parvibaculum sedimenti]|uniref:Porin n=1 Tax=Parvibaculum sedimenti TaxID=2608632 RepID=A0A6N6VLE8_9HYPH|nr:porin [Parvibaculum sedimenti]KAB7742350.1 porin [Parvibaculum sedimenti]
MKKTLLGTTALIAAVALSAPAHASDPLKVTIGGNIVTGFYAVDADSIAGTSFQDTKVPLVARNIDIKAEGTLDNGLVAGVDAKLQLGHDWSIADALGQGNSGASFRQLFAYLEGDFGKFEIGGTDGAAYKMHYTSPWFVPGNGVDSPNILNVPIMLVRHSTFSLLATDSNKVTYFTPRFSGFQLGLSFTPTVAVASGMSSNLALGPSENGLLLAPKDQGVSNVFEAALNYAGTFGGVDVGADVFYTKGSGDYLAGDQGDPKEWGLGLNLGYSGFTLGGAYYRSEDIYGSWGAVPSQLGFDDTTWTAGLKYATGPWTVGVAYLDTDQNVNIVDMKSKNWQVGGGYNLGSGVDLGLDLQSTKFEVAGYDYDSKSVGLVLAIAF